MLKHVIKLREAIGFRGFPSGSVVKSENENRLVVSNSLQTQRLYCPWNSLGQNTGVGSLSLLQGIFPTQELNPGLPHRRQILYWLSHKAIGTTQLKKKKKMGKRLEQTLHKQDIWMAGRHVKRCSSSSLIKEMKIKTTMRDHLPWARKPIIRKRDSNKCWWGCGKTGAFTH